MARKYTKKNTKYWEKDTAYSEYVKEFKRIEKVVRRGAGVKTGTVWKQGHGKWIDPDKRVISIEVRAKMHNRANFRRYVAKYGETSAQVAAGQFNLLSEELATTVQENLKKAGIKKADGTEYSLIEIRARQLPQEAWDTMEMVAEADGTDINNYFFGS